MQNREKTYYKTYYTSPIGELLLVSDGQNLCGVWLKGQKYYASKLGDTMPLHNDLKIFKDTKRWLDSYFNGQKPDIKMLRLDPHGSDFQKEVWDLLCKIPYGQLTTYKTLAQKMAEKMNKKTMSAQAVGSAIGHNPISIIVPCHRVIATNGSLTGYAGGLKTKAKLLELEGIEISNYKCRL